MTRIVYTDLTPLKHLGVHSVHNKDDDILYVDRRNYANQHHGLGDRRRGVRNVMPRLLGRWPANRKDQSWAG